MTALSRQAAKTILAYCHTPRTAKEIVTALKVNHNLTPTLVRNGWLKRLDTSPLTFQTAHIPPHLDWPAPVSPKNLHLLTALLDGQRAISDLKGVSNRPDIAYESLIEHRLVERTYDPAAFHLSPKGEEFLASLGLRRRRINSIFNFGALNEPRSLSQSV